MFGRGFVKGSDLCRGCGVKTASDQLLSLGCFFFFFFKSAALLGSPVTAMPHGREEAEMGGDSGEEAATKGGKR